MNTVRDMGNSHTILVENRKVEDDLKCLNRDERSVLKQFLKAVDWIFLST